MSDVLLRAAGADRMTSVPNVFIDSYMKGANGEYVKVYLYLLRCLGDSDMDFSVAGMADALDHTQRDISRALSHWEKAGLLRLEYTADGELSGICLVEPVLPMVSPRGVSVRADMTVRQDNAMAGRADSVIRQETHSDVAVRQGAEIVPIGAGRSSFATGPDYTYSLDELQLLGKDLDVQEILCVTERYLGRPLSATESNSVLYWYDGMEMSADLIEYLVEYCVDHGHKSIHYMNKVAANWAEDGIATVEQAKGTDATFNRVYRIVAQEFGISGRNLTPPERDYLEKWSGTMGFSEELIGEACRRTILKTGRTSFQYADSILKSWHTAGVSTMDAVAKLDAAHKQVVKLHPTTKNASANVKKDRFHNFDERGYDYNAIQTLLIQQQ